MTPKSKAIGKYSKEQMKTYTVDHIRKTNHKELEATKKYHKKFGTFEERLKNYAKSR